MNVSRLTLILLLLLLPTVVASAQRGGNCNRYEDAREAYIVGAFDEAIGLARRCIEHPPRPDELALRSVYPLLVQAYLARPDPREAREMVAELHTMDPSYRPDPLLDPPAFRQLFSEVVADMAEVPPLPERPAADAPLLYFDTREINLDREIPVPRVEPELQRALGLEGFAVTTRPEHADYVVEVNAHARSGVELYGRYTAYADLAVTVSEPNTGLEVFKATVQDVKAGGVDFPDAGLHALSEAATAFRTAYLDDFVYALHGE